MFLACNPDRGYTAEELRDHLSSDPDKPLSRDSIRTYAGALRRQLGADYFPDGGWAGYRLVGVATDWHRFQDLLRAADSSSEAAVTAQHLASTLALVRGEPLPSGTNGAFRCADHDLRSSIEVTVTDTASRLAELAQAHADHQLAAWAAAHGLLAEKHSNRLNALALTAAQASGEPDRLARAWREVTRRFSPDPVPDNLATLYESLRSSRPTPAPA